MRQYLECFLLLVLLLICGMSCQTGPKPEEMTHYVVPAHRLDDGFSSNWVAETRSVLPQKYAKDEGLTFQTATNLLSRESARGNYKAMELWGLAKVLRSTTVEGVDEGMQLMQTSAEHGNVLAMFNLGLLFSQGKYVRKDYTQSFHWYEMAADTGMAEAELELGACYYYGLGVSPNFAMSVKYYRLAAEQTNYVAMKSLGFALSNGPEVSRDKAAAKYWTERAATEGGNARAMYNLGVFALQDSTNKEACDIAFQWYKRSAEKNDALAAWSLANCYLFGQGVETNLPSYRYWRFKAATLGSTEAQYFMSAAYRIGDGVPVDEENSLIWCIKAAQKNQPAALFAMYMHCAAEKTNTVLADAYLLRAAQMGQSEAQFRYALACFQGTDFPQDFEAGKTWLQESADNNWDRAEFELFALYNSGLPPATNCPAYPKDRTEALKWLRRAAEHGNLDAQSRLAISLIQGVDMEQNKPEGEKLLRSAASHGWGVAENDLGFAILNGDCASTDRVESAMWCKLATDTVTDPKVLHRARVNLDHAISFLTPAEQDEVFRRASDFKPVPVIPGQPFNAGWETNSAYQREDGEFGH